MKSNNDLGNIHYILNYNNIIDVLEYLETKNKLLTNKTSELKKIDWLPIKIRKLPYEILSIEQNQ